MTRRMSIALRAGVSALLLALVIAFADWEAVIGVLRDVNGAWVACAFGIAVLDRVVINYRWQILLAGLGVRIGFWPLLRVQLAANFAGSFMPSSIGVDALRVTALVRGGEPMAPVVASTLVDRLSLALASLLFGSAMLVALARTRVPAELANVVFVLTALGVLGFAVCLHPRVRRSVREKLLSRAPKKFRHTLGTIGEAAIAYRRQWRVLAGLAAVTLALFMVRILFAKALGLAAGVDVPVLDLLLVIPLLWIMVMLPITIGSIGVQEAGYAMLMALIGVGPAIAVSMSLIEHVTARAASLPGLLFIGDFLPGTRTTKNPSA